MSKSTFEAPISSILPYQALCPTPLNIVFYLLKHTLWQSQTHSLTFLTLIFPAQKANVSRQQTDNQTITDTCEFRAYFAPFISETTLVDILTTVNGQKLISLFSHSTSRNREQSAFGNKNIS